LFSKSHSDDIKPYAKSGSSPSPYSNQRALETKNHKTKKCAKSKKSNKKHSTAAKKSTDLNEKEIIDKGFNSYATTISTSSNGSDSVNTNSEKENEQLKLQSNNQQNNTVKTSSNYANVQNTLSVVETGVQTQLTNDEAKNDAVEERKYVEELKTQLDSLRSEIGRLQDAQSNLEKSLKTQAAFRPLLLSDFDGKTSMKFSSLYFLNKLNIFLNKTNLKKKI
jgi:hypothetical protein